MLPEHIALLIDKIARRAGCAVTFEPAVYVAVRDEADVHAVRLVRDPKADLPRVFAHLVLARAFAQRDYAPRDRLARQAVHHIGLILGCAGAQQQRAAHSVAPGAGVMPGRNIRRTDPVRIIGQRAELDQRVAHHTGIGRARIAEGIRKIGAHPLLERLAPVCDIKWDAQLVRCALRRLLAAEAHLKEQAVHLEALRGQPCRGDRGIHAAR